MVMISKKIGNGHRNESNDKFFLEFSNRLFYLAIILTVPEKGVRVGLRVTDRNAIRGSVLFYASYS